MYCAIAGDKFTSACRVVNMSMEDFAVSTGTSSQGVEGELLDDWRSGTMRMPAVPAPQ